MPKSFPGHRSRLLNPLLILLFILYCWSIAAWLLPSYARMAAHGPGAWFAGLGFALLASCTVTSIVNVIRTMRLSRAQAGPVPEKVIAPVSRNFGFSRREEEVCTLLMKGYRNRRIAEELFISVSTVKSHVYSIFRKAGVRSRAELLFLCRDLARDRGWRG